MRLRPERPLSDLLKLAGFATGNSDVRLQTWSFGHPAHLEHS